MKLNIIIVSLFLIISHLHSQINLMNVRPWAYQLQNVDINEISMTDNIKLIVIDYSLDGTDEYKFSNQDIVKIKNYGKYAISYISIGEAEDYRYYWNENWKSNPPEWLGPENPDWPGNYKVKFWSKEWQDIIFGYIDTIINQGFDGIYLDIIDGWYYWFHENPQMNDADSLMCRFVINIRDYANSKSGDQNFIIIPQNGEDIIYQQNVQFELRKSYLDAINAIGIEDVFYPGSNDENNSYNPDQYRIDNIKNYLAEGKQVYSIEYLTDKQKIDQYIKAATEKKFVPYSCARALDQICPAIIVGVEEEAPTSNSIISPNPFSESTTINYELQTAGRVRIDIFNSLGDKISTLVDKWQEAGRHNEELRIENYELSAGMYFYRKQVGDSIECGKLVLIR